MFTYSVTKEARKCSGEKIVSSTSGDGNARELCVNQ